MIMFKDSQRSQDSQRYSGQSTTLRCRKRLSESKARLQRALSSVICSRCIRVWHIVTERPARISWNKRSSEWTPSPVKPFPKKSYLRLPLSHKTPTESAAQQRHTPSSPQPVQIERKSEGETRRLKNWAGYSGTDLRGHHSASVSSLTHIFNSLADFKKVPYKSQFEEVCYKTDVENGLLYNWFWKGLLYNWIWKGLLYNLLWKGPF